MKTTMLILALFIQYAGYSFNVKNRYENIRKVGILNVELPPESKKDSTTIKLVSLNSELSDKVSNEDQVASLYYAKLLIEEIPKTSDTLISSITNFNIAYTFEMGGRYKEAIIYYKKVIASAISLNEQDIIKIAYYRVATCYSQFGLHDKAIIAFDNAREEDISISEKNNIYHCIIKECFHNYYILKQKQLAKDLDVIKKDSIESGNTKNLISSYLSLAGIYQNTNDRNEFLTSTRNYISLAQLQNNSEYILLGYVSLMEDALQHEEYFGALYHAMEAIEIMVTRPSPETKTNLIKLLRDNRESNHEFGIILKYYEEFLNESSYNSRKETFYTLKTMLDDSFISENEKAPEKKLYVIIYWQLSIIIFFVIFGGLYLFLTKYWKRSSVTNEIINNNEPDSQQKTLIDNQILADEGNEKQSTILYKKIIELLKSEKLYLVHNISQHDVATRLGTNKSYLYQAIKINSEHNFNSLINTFRINYAKEIIKKRVQSGTHYTLSEIFEECGFSTVESFYRSFRTILGQTPGEFAKEIEESLYAKSGETSHPIPAQSGQVNQFKVIN